MGLKVYVNGEFYEKGEACVSVYDHGLLYGDGVFEGIRVYGGTIWRCGEHMDRLYASAQAIDLRIPMAREELIRAMENTLEVNGLNEAYIRLVVTRGVGDLGLDPYECSEPQVIIITDSIALYPPEFYEKGLELVTVSTVRIHPRALDARVKSLNYLNNILGKIECLRAGASEGVMLNSEGHVTECTGDNIFVVDAGKLLTPPADAGILVGITRNVVMELAAQAGMEAREQDLVPEDLYAAQECFLTGTAAEIAPVVRIDGRQIGDGKPGPVTRELLGMFRQLTKQGSG